MAPVFWWPACPDAFRSSHQPWLNTCCCAGTKRTNPICISDILNITRSPDITACFFFLSAGWNSKTYFSNLWMDYKSKLSLRTTKYTSVGESRGHTQAHTPSFSFSSLHSSTFLLQVKSFFICKKKKKKYSLSLLWTLECSSRPTNPISTGDKSFIAPFYTFSHSIRHRLRSWTGQGPVGFSPDWLVIHILQHFDWFYCSSLILQIAF